MRIRLISYMLYTALCLSVLLSTQAQNAQDVHNSQPVKVYQFAIHEDIMPGTVRLVDRALEQALAMDADYILLDLDSYGGMLDAGDSVHIKLLRCPIPVLCYISNNAASAGALIAISCDSIYMSPFAKIGAASVVDQNGALVDEKYQAYMRGIMRSTAEATGRNPEIAEAMVQGGGGVPGIIDSGKILTFTTKEALLHGYCEGESASLQGVYAVTGINNPEVSEHHLSGMDKVMNFLLNPVLRGLCITFIFLGLYFELQSPGIGFALVIAIIAALLYFGPLYVEGLAAHWEVLLFVIGVLLLLAEIFVIPGFGVAGVTGIILVFIGLALSMVGNSGLNFELSGLGVLTESLLIVFSSLIVAAVVMFAFFGRFLKSGVFRKLSLETSENAQEGYHTTIFHEPANLIGKIGIAMTDLRPSGKIEIDNAWYDAQSEASYITKGTKVKVLDVKNNYLIVRES